MSVEVHVEGQIVYGRLPDFMDAVAVYSSYARDQGYGVPRVLQGISGPMNTVRLIYAYDDLTGYEHHEARTGEDREYGRLAMAMPFAEGTINYTIYHAIE